MNRPVPRKCPHCGSARVIPIVYGLPGPELFQAAERGEVALGGCLVDDRNPMWHCNGCGVDGGRRVRKFDSGLQGDAHQEFEEWRRLHPDAFVLNHRGIGEVMLHQAGCLHLRFGPADKVDLARQPKWCSESEDELLEAASEAGLRVLRCQTCRT